MLLPVSQVASLVNALNLTWVDKVYPNAIPNEEPDNTDLTVSGANTRDRFKPGLPCKQHV
ncbi:DUF806 family protein [Lactiplantibacillus plantarum]|uniref:DUF806 family protein n=1 Tax=Lactiplantibacillus plantarum TaxID=1590 RepID=UPI0025723212|nr:DUF806 family protein [Lactiplantibacillus plantarum]BEI54996.1 hypothetical protein AWA2045_31270 [Lactiplantibacillus plantarum]